MTWFARLIIGLIISSVGFYFYKSNVLDVISANMEASEEYESEYDPDDYDYNDDEDEDHYAYDEYDTGDDY